MKILFVFPLNEPYETIISAGLTPWRSKLGTHRNIKKIDSVYPTGLMSIAAYVKKQLPETEIRIIDLNVILKQLATERSSFADFSRDDFFAHAWSKLGDFTPDLVGVSSLFCSNYRDLKPLLEFLKPRYPAALLTGGGHLSAALYSRMFADGLPFDGISFGEGEIPVTELCRAWLKGEAKEFLESDPCWITAAKLRRQPDFQPERRLIEDLDEIPPYDFNMLLAPEDYFNSSSYFFVIETAADCREMFIFSTRGCPHHCVFCASQNVHGHRVRYFSTERIKNDILYYHRTFGIKRFVFYDDHFLVRKARAIEILDFVAAHGLIAEIPTPAFFSIDAEVAAAMRRAGIREVNITIESGNEDTLKRIMHKPANLRKAEEAVEHLHRNGIMAISNILIGLPGETPESIDQGTRYLATTQINWFQCFVTAPLPGSELYEICRENGYLVEEDVTAMDFKKGFIATPDFTAEFIEKKAYEMNLYLNFVNNYDYRAGHYEVALRLFERILSTVINTHAFAYYFAAKCCEQLNLTERYGRHRDKYREMLELYPFWREWADHFQLPPLE